MREGSWQGDSTVYLSSSTSPAHPHSQSCLYNLICSLSGFFLWGWGHHSFQLSTSWAVVKPPSCILKKVNRFNFFCQVPPPPCCPLIWFLSAFPPALFPIPKVKESTWHCKTLLTGEDGQKLKGKCSLFSGQGLGQALEYSYVNHFCPVTALNNSSNWNGTGVTTQDPILPKGILWGILQFSPLFSLLLDKRPS